MIFMEKYQHMVRKRFTFIINLYEREKEERWLVLNLQLDGSRI